MAHAFHVAPAQASASRRRSVVEQALRLRLPRRSSDQRKVGRRQLPQLIGRSGCAAKSAIRRKIFFKGKLRGKVTAQGAVTGLFTVDDNPKDDGMGPAVFGITGRMTRHPLKLELSFEFDDAADGTDDDDVS